MKSAATSMAMVLYIVRESQALSNGNGAIAVTSFLPAITVSSCLSSGIAPSQVASGSLSEIAQTPVFTTVLTQPCPSGFTPVTYTVTAQPADIPPGFTTGVAVVNSRTELVTYPTASASKYAESGYISPISTGGVVSSDESRSGTTVLTAPAVGGNAGSGGSRGGSVLATSSGWKSASNQEVAAPSAGSPPPVSGAGILSSGAAGAGIGGSHTTLPSRSSNSTVPSSTSSMAIYTGGASTGRVVSINAGLMLTVLIFGAVLM
jgi:hypothetical protein